MDLAAETKVVVPPDPNTWQAGQELHCFVHALAIVEHVSQHDERVYLPGLQLSHGGSKWSHCFVNVGQKSESHTGISKKVTPRRRLHAALIEESTCRAQM